MLFFSTAPGRFSYHSLPNGWAGLPLHSVTIDGTVDYGFPAARFYTNTTGGVFPNGVMPSGLVLDAATGLVSGTPTGIPSPSAFALTPILVDGAMMLVVYDKSDVVVTLANDVGSSSAALPIVLGEALVVSVVE